jgi:ADP-ribose pyrophosphatase
MDTQSGGSKKEIIPWELLNEEDISPSHYFPLFKQKVKIHNGKVFDDYYITKLVDATMVVAVTKEKELLMVRQWRQGTLEITLELPCGQNDPHESTLDAAKRELHEETGATITSELIPLGKVSPITPKATLRIYGYFCTIDSLLAKQDLDDTENIEVVKVPFADIDRLLLSGEINAADTISFISLARITFPDVFSRN